MDFNFSAIPYYGTFESKPTWEVGIKTVFYVMSVTFAFIGNSAVIFIVWRTKRLQTTTNFYLVNLAIADLMVAAFCSWVHLVNDLTEGWVLGAFFCKFNSFVQVVSLVAGILTLTLISCDRFFGIVFAMKAHLTERRASTCIVLVWVCSIAVSSPLLKHRQQFIRQWSNHTEIWCDDSWPSVILTDEHGNLIRYTEPARTAYYTAVSVVLFFLPILVMTIAYTFIIVKLWSKRIPGERVESGTLAQKRVKRKVVIMLVTLLVVFVICWLPLQCAILYAEHIIHTKSHQDLCADVCQAKYCVSPAHVGKCKTKCPKALKKTLPTIADTRVKTVMPKDLIVLACFTKYAQQKRIKL